jgi:hypothetical protein
VRIRGIRVKAVFDPYYKHTGRCFLGKELAVQELKKHKENGALCDLLWLSSVVAASAAPGSLVPVCG